MRVRALLTVPVLVAGAVAGIGATDAVALPSGVTQVAVTTGNVHSAVDGHLKSAASIAGTIKTSKGKLVSGNVAAYRKGVPVGFAAVNNGAYQFNGLPAGSYAVCISGANVYSPL